MGLGPTRDLGPAIIEWGATEIAETFDEVRWMLTSEEAEVFEAKFGATPVDTVFLGYSACEVTVPATRILLATLATLMPGGTNPNSEYVGVKPGLSVGNSMYVLGLPLFVKPIVAGIAAVNGKWLRLERTYPSPNFEVVFNVRDQRVYGIKFKAHPDEASALLWSMGEVAEGTSY